MHLSEVIGNVSALLPFLVVLLGQVALSFVLEGSTTSYAQFRKWNAGLNGTLEFEFKTEQGNGLLLYTDDGGTYDFFEVKLVESALRLRYNLGGGAQIVTVGHDLGDGHWHKVQITRYNENTTLTVDSVSAVSTSRGKEFEFGKLAGNSDVYVGGMPSWYNSKLTLLALPSVIFEPRFNGFIRNLVYADGENTVPRRQEMKSRDAKCGGFPCVENVKRKTPRSLRNMMTANTTDACEIRDPCQHGGICISTDSGPICECRSGDYEGAYCEKEAWSTVLPTAGAGEYWEWEYNKAPSEASFRGTEYLTIDLSKGDPVLSTQESISLQFKTRQPNGLLFYSGEGDDYLTVSLRDGGAAVGMTLAKGRLDLHVKPIRVRFDDNQWHKIIVHRKVQEISSITSFCRLPTMRIDSIVPNFDAETTQGPINFYKWQGDSWVVLFSHPADFTPVCTTELGRLAVHQPHFQRRNTKLLAHSVDKLQDHVDWVNDIKSYCQDICGAFPYPIIADHDRKLAVKLEMIDEKSKDDPQTAQTVRALYIISPDHRLRLSMMYPTSTGRNVDEILRVIDSLQLVDRKPGIATPANWVPGEKVMILPTVKDEDLPKLFPKGVDKVSMPSGKVYLSAFVDGIYSEHGHTAGSFTHLASDRLLVGGGADARSLQGAKGINNFVGCLRKVEFIAEGVKMELIEAARSGAAGAAAWGKMDFHCREPKASDPITFTTRDSHLVLPPWKAAKAGSISFKIRTNEPNGLIMYSRSGAHMRQDLFAFELFGGHLYLHADLGSGSVKVKSSKQRVDDGTWHDVALRRVGRDGRVIVDGWSVEFRTPGDSTQLDLDGLMYIGGVGAPFAPLTVPPVLWTGTLRQGYVGCMRDLVINGQPIDIAGYAQQQDSGAVRPACHSQPPHCPSQPCMHGGHCVEGWNRFHCDCTATPYTGPTCGKDTSTLHLNGTQQMTALMPEDSKTQAEEVVIRFKTTRPGGLLLSTSLENSPDRLQIYLEEGKAKLLIHIGDKEKALVAGQGLNDDMWHTLRFSRRAGALKFQIDDEPAVQAEISLDKQSILEFRTLHVGGYQHAGEEIPHFIGQLQQIWFNGYPYLEIARSSGNHQASHQGVTPIIRVTGKFGKRNHPVHHPVTFTSKHTFVGLPVLKAYVETNIYFQFKTREANGLILFNAGRERDFIAVELVNSHIHYVFDLGDGPVRVRDSSRSRLNDGKWHAVSIGRPAPKRHTLAVDDHVTAVNSQGSSENLDLDGILYIGGVEKTQYGQLPKQILSKHGFEGCLASLDLSGESTNLISDAVVPSSLVESGCDMYASLHPGKKCTHDLCSNHGTCVQQWNSYTCDCDMTSFIGPTCNEEAIAYEFGAGRGIITYTFPPDRRPEMKRDTVALGFVTSVNDAVLLKIESSSSNDYLEIEIVEGNVFAVYNMGTNDHPIGEVGVKVNDNQYHVVRFTRTGPNSTLQVDDYNLQSNHPSGRQLSVFNSQSTIQVGGRWNRNKGRVERPFLGIIAGLVVNGARILELAAATDGRITTRGDVQLLPAGSLSDRAVPLQRMQQTPASGFPGVADDLIFSGAGSGCAADDEDEECTPIYEPGSDDIITPVYVAPTRSPTTYRPKQHKENYQARPSCDDEEDCEEGSGEPITTEEIFVTSATDSSSVAYTTTREYTTSHISTQTSPGSPSTSTRDIVTVSVQYNVSTTDLETSHPSSIVTQRSTAVTTQTTTTEMTDPPPPPPPPFHPPMPTPPKNNNNKRITSEAAENAALIIGIIAAALIAIVLIILIILKFKNRPETSYKVDETKTLCQDPNAALLGAAGSGQTFNGALKNGANGSKVNKKRELIDIKEWYV